MPPKPDPGLGPSHSLHGKDNGGEPGDDRRAPGGNESQERSSGEEFCHARDYVRFGSEVDLPVLLKVDLLFQEFSGIEQCLFNVCDYRGVVGLSQHKKPLGVVIDFVVSARVCPIAEVLVLGQSDSQVI